MTDLYAVMGNPIAHSKSPLIHTEFARQTGQDLSYSAILVEINNFAQAVTAFAAQNGKGLNITVPFKEQAWQFVDERSPLAEKAGAVNTISFQQGKTVGDNTDGVGIVRDLQQNHEILLRNKRLLVLGAGGAVRGVLGPILDEQPQSIVIANRTVNRAQQLVSIFNQQGKLKASGFNELDDCFDVVINGTAASLGGEMPPLPAQCVENAACYDMMYASDDTVFMRWCKSNGANKVLDGLGMLVEQAAESFYLWRGVRPNTASVIDYIRSSFNSK